MQGKITDLLGNPLPESIIQIEDRTKTKYPAVSDKEGNYIVKGFVCGRIEVTFTQRNFYQENRILNLPEGKDQTLNLGLKMGWISDAPVLKIKWKVVDETGKKISSANIKVTATLNDKVFDSEISDSRGFFEAIVNNFGKFNIEITAMIFKNSFQTAS